MQTKTCSKCGATKDIGDFYLLQGIFPLQYCNKCKVCLDKQRVIGPAFIEYNDPCTCYICSMNKNYDDEDEEWF